MGKQDLSVPQSGLSDVAHTGVTVALSAIPLLGLGELFKAIVTPPLEKRRDEWMAKVEVALKRLQESRAVLINELAENEEFITLLLQASQMAVRTHLDSKRELFKNALLSHLVDGLEFDVVSNYLEIIDHLQPMHLLLLKRFQEVEAMNQFGEKAKYLEFMAEALPITIDTPFIESFISDLARLGLITDTFITETSEWDGAVLGGGVYYYNHVLSSFGKKFLDFVSKGKQ